MKSVSLLIVLLTLLLASPISAEEKNPMVLLKTNLGEMKIELYQEKAPITVENFLKYVEDGFFDGTIFHRVMPDFVIQGGGYDKDMEKKKTRAPIKNEGKNGVKNLKYTLSMARTNDPDSATSQFFVNLKDNDSLDPSSFNPAGYAVFGKVVEGQKIVDKIGKVKTRYINPQWSAPLEPVVIEKAVLIETKDEKSELKKTDSKSDK